ncbi:hypothetical protein CR513_40086, partial [Mucuna pruriens]
MSNVSKKELKQSVGDHATWKNHVILDIQPKHNPTFDEWKCTHFDPKLENAMGLYRIELRRVGLRMVTWVGIGRLKYNILSISQLCDHRHDVSFNKWEYVVKNIDGSLMFSTRDKIISTRLI